MPAHGAMDMCCKPLLDLCSVENMSAVDELCHFLVGAKDVERNGTNNVDRLFDVLEPQPPAGASYFTNRRRHHHGIIKLLQELI